MCCKSVCSRVPDRKWLNGRQAELLVACTQAWETEHAAPCSDRLQALASRKARGWGGRKRGREDRSRGEWWSLSPTRERLRKRRRGKGGRNRIRGEWYFSSIREKPRKRSRGEW